MATAAEERVERSVFVNEDEQNTYAYMMGKMEKTNAGFVDYCHDIHQ